MKPVTIDDVAIALYIDRKWENEKNKDLVKIAREEFIDSMLRQGVASTNTTINLKWRSLKVSEKYCASYDDELDAVYLRRHTIEKEILSREGSQ